MHGLEVQQQSVGGEGAVPAHRARPPVGLAVSAQVGGEEGGDVENLPAQRAVVATHGVYWRQILCQQRNEYFMSGPVQAKKLILCQIWHEQKS